MPQQSARATPQPSTARALGTLLAIAATLAGLLTGVSGPGRAVAADAAEGASTRRAPAPPGAPPGAPLVLADGAGRTRLLLARPGARLAAAPAGARGPVARARAQLDTAAGAFGLRDVTGLRALRVSRAPSGHDVVRFQQTLSGVPVLGGVLVAVLDRAGSLVSVAGEVSQAAGATTYDALPSVPASAAARTARRAVAARHGLPRGALTAARPTRAVYDPSLIEPGAPAQARGVWQVEVGGPVDVRELVLVDSATGAVRLQVDQVAHVLDRVVCDDAGLSTMDEVCRPGEYTRVEGQPATGIADVDQAYDLTGLTAAWFAARLGVDLTDLIGNDLGDGRKLRSTTRYCGPEGCPLDNAFWNGEQMVYGAGFTSADDVVAHELAHGVSQRVAGLVYWFQSGAINESVSDVFGELVDLTDGVGTDGDDVRWLLGEDLPPAAGGVARDMADPRAFGQPDHTGSDLYDFAPDYDDNGGVHTNSGVANKTAYLIADGTAGEPGGAFNGAAFAGIGLDKTALLYWSALPLLTPGADFVDLAGALQSACTQLAATGAGAVTAADCSSVSAAVAATGLTRWTGPSSPRAVRMVAGVRSVWLAWDPPADAGSSPLTSYVVWVRPAVDVREDFTALEPAARSHVIEGLRPGVDYTVGIAAVTADGTSAPVTRRFTGSGLRLAWPSGVTWGERLRVPGVLAGAGGVPQPGRAVRLLRRFPGERGFEEVAGARTAGDGSFVLRVAARRGATYVVTSAPGAGVLGDRSRSRAVPLRPRVTVSTDPTLRAAQTPRFRGSVAPARSGAEVRLQRRLADGSWRTVARARLDAAGRYEVSAPFGAPRPAVWRVRVGAWAGAGLAAGVSREVAVTPAP